MLQKVVRLLTGDLGVILNLLKNLWLLVLGGPGSVTSWLSSGTWRGCMNMQSMLLV